MSYATEQIVRTELQAGERLLWSGQPRQGLRFTLLDIYVIPLTLVWASLTALAVVESLSGEVGRGVPVVAALFVPIALYITVGRFIVDIRQRARTHYALTSERVVVISGLLSREVTSIPLRSLGEVSLSERSDRSGTIYLGSRPPLAVLMEVQGWPSSPRLPPRIGRIERVRDVYTQIRQAQLGRS
jgi:hypothetical protein